MPLAGKGHASDGGRLKAGTLGDGNVGEGPRSTEVFVYAVDRGCWLKTPMESALP